MSYCAALIILFGVAASTGCADYANTPDHGCSQAVLSSACYRIWAANDQRAAAANPDPIFSAYVGKDIHAVFAKIGYPDGQREIAGDSVFTWSIESDSDIELPTATTTTGDVGGIPFTATTMGSETIHRRHWCRLEYVTTSNWQIKSYSWKGSRNGCGPTPMYSSDQSSSDWAIR